MVEENLEGLQTLSAERLTTSDTYLGDVIQHILREVQRLKELQARVGAKEMAAAEWHAYYVKVGQTIERCLVFGEVVEAKLPLNDMIGHYLLAAKKEAERLKVATASQLVAENARINQLEQQLSERQLWLTNYRQIIVDQEEQIAAQNKAGKALVVNELATDEVASTIRKEADRYARQRKLMADDQVVFAKKEIDLYQATRYRELAAAEEQFVALIQQLQLKFDHQVAELLDGIAAYAQQEAIVLPQLRADVDSQ